MSTIAKRRHNRNGGGKSKNGNGHGVPIQIDGRTLRGLSNGNIRDRNELAARLVRGDAKPVRLNVAQAAALACTTTAGIYGALRQLP
jgi:hypothetical protein